MATLNEEVIELIEGAKEDYTRLKKAPLSIKFWNVMAIILTIISGFISLPLMASILITASILTFYLYLENKLDDNYWTYLTPIAFVLYLVILFCFIGSVVKYKVIIPFNNFLDKR